MDIQDYIQSGIIESYVLGLATPEEKTELEELRLKYPEVQKAIDDFELSIEQQAFRDAVAPPPGLKTNIWSAINHESPTETILARIPEIEDNKPAAPVRKMFNWQMVAAASVILLAGSMATNLYLYNKYSKRETDYQALLSEKNTLQANSNIYQTKINEWQSLASLMASPGMKMVKMPGITGKENHNATVLWNASTSEVYIMPDQLPQVNTGKQYQLWALVDGKPVDAGLIEPNCTVLCKMKNIPQAQAFAITIEQAGGSVSPTLDQMVVLGKI